MSRIGADRKIIGIPVCMALSLCQAGESIARNSAWGTFRGEPRITVIQGKMHVDLENDPQPPLELSHRVLDAGGAAVEIGGELDVATADAAFTYVRQVIDRNG